METLRIDGIRTIDGGEYDRVQVDGIGKCRGNIKTRTIDIDGMFRCEGSVEAEQFDCDGTVKISGNVRAGRIDIDGIMTVTGGTKIESGEIYCDGIIRINGEISADRIEADGCISACEIVGEYIRIHSHGHWLMSFLGFARSKIDLIEATGIELRGVVAGTVNGRNIVIGPGCKIENLDCSGKLRVSPKAQVGTISGNFTKED